MYSEYGIVQAVQYIIGEILRRITILFLMEDLSLTGNGQRAT